jgi:hypothetical protein
MMKVEKIDNERKIISKINRMFNQFNIILASFGVYLNKTEIGLNSLIGNRNKKSDRKFLYYVGKGNNKNLIVSIFKKRWWWIET